MEGAVVEYAKRFGGASATTLFDLSTQIFSLPNIEGAIGYRIESNCAVVFGDPLCDPTNIPELVKSFHRFCKEKDLRIIYLTVSEGFAKWAVKHVCSCLIEVCEELSVDPFRNPKSGSKGRALRNKINLAMRAGIQISEYIGGDVQLEKAMEQVGVSWLKARQGPQIYIGHVELFVTRTGKRWFYARQGDQIVGTLLLHRVEARHGWLVQFLMTTPDAPQGTSEQLVMSALNNLQTEGCRFLSFGAVQIESLGEIIGLGWLFEKMARILFKIAKKMFHLDQRRRYWRKFQPQKEPSYVLFSESKRSLRELQSIKRAFNVSLVSHNDR